MKGESSSGSGVAGATRIVVDLGAVGAINLEFGAFRIGGAQQAQLRTLRVQRGIRHVPEVKVSFLEQRIEQNVGEAMICAFVCSIDLQEWNANITT